MAVMPVGPDNFKFQAQQHVHSMRTWKGTDEFGSAVEWDPKAHNTEPVEHQTEELAALMLLSWRRQAASSLRPVVQMGLAAAGAGTGGGVQRTPVGADGQVQAPQAAAETRRLSAEEQTGCRRGYLHHLLRQGERCSICGAGHAGAAPVAYDPNRRVPVG